MRFSSSRPEKKEVISTFGHKNFLITFPPYIKCATALMLHTVVCSVVQLQKDHKMHNYVIIDILYSVQMLIDSELSGIHQSCSKRLFFLQGSNFLAKCPSPKQLSSQRQILRRFKSLVFLIENGQKKYHTAAHCTVVFQDASYFSM